MKKILTILFVLSCFAGHSQDTKVTAPLGRNKPLDLGYATHIDTLGKGGFMAMSDTLTRNALPASVRKKGMLISVLPLPPDSIPNYYTLIGGITNSNWKRVYISLTGNSLLIDSVIVKNPFLYIDTIIVFGNPHQRINFNEALLDSLLRDASQSVISPDKLISTGNIALSDDTTVTIFGPIVYRINGTTHSVGSVSYDIDPVDIGFQRMDFVWADSLEVLHYVKGVQDTSRILMTSVPAGGILVTAFTVKSYFGVASNSPSGSLIGGVVSHDTLYRYVITPATATINNMQYLSGQSSVTLQPADLTFDRKDVIADSLGVIVVKTGIAAADPLEPQVDLTKEIALTNITVKAGTTAPDNIVQNIVYDENVESWTHAKTGPFIVDFASTTPFHLAKAIDIGAWSGTTNSITFTSPVKINAADYSLIKLYVRPKAALPSNVYIYLRLMNGTTGVTPFVKLTSYGLNNSVLTYQNVSILVSQLNLTSPQYDKIQMLFYGPSGGVYMDYIQLQGGIVNGGDQGTVTASNLLTKIGNNIQLGGSATKDDTLDLNNHKLSTQNGHVIINELRSVSPQGDDDLFQVNDSSGYPLLFANSQGHIAGSAIWYNGQYRSSFQANLEGAQLNSQSADGINTGNIQAVQDGTLLLSTSKTLAISDSSLATASNGYVFTLMDQLTGRGAWRSSASSGGTVFSVGLTSSDITVGGTSPITTSGTYTLTLPTVNSNVGTFTNATVTANAKGQITAVSNGASATDSAIWKNSATYTPGNKVLTMGNSTQSFSGNKVIFDSVRVGASPSVIGTITNTPFATSMPTGWSAHVSTTLGITYDAAGATVVGANFWTQPSSGSITTAYRAGIQFNTYRMPWEKIKYIITLIPKNKVSGGAVALATGNMGLNYNTSPNFIFDLSNGSGSGSGRPGFDTLSNANTGDSAMKLSWNVDDTLQLVVEKDGWSVTGYMLDKNTGAWVSNPYNLNWNSTGGLLNLVFLKGTFKLLNVNIYSWNKKGVPYFLSTSMWSGSGNTSMQRRTPSIVMNNDVEKYEVVGLPSLETKYAVQGGLIPEIIAVAQPSHVIYNWNFNDESANEGAPATNIATDSVFAPLVRASIPVYVTSIQPRISITTHIYNDSLIALVGRRPGTSYINTLSSLVKSNSAMDENNTWDLLHENDTGSIKEARPIIAAIGNIINKPLMRDTVPLGVFNNAPMAIPAQVTSLFGLNSKREIVKIANFLPSINKFALIYDYPQSYSGSSFSSTPPQIGGIHVSRDVTTDSAFNSKNPNGWYGGLNADGLTTRRNVIFDAGGPSGLPGQRFISSTGTSNVMFHLASSPGIGFTGNYNFLHIYSNATGFTGSNSACFSCGVFGATSGTNLFGWGAQSLKGVTTASQIIDMNYNPSGSDLNYNVSNSIFIGDGLTNTNDPKQSGDVAIAAGYFTGTKFYIGGRTSGAANSLRFASIIGTNQKGFASPINASPSTGLAVGGDMTLNIVNPSTTGSTTNTGTTAKVLVTYLGTTVGTSATTHAPDAALEVNSTTQSFLPARVTTTQKNSMSSGIQTLGGALGGTGYPANSAAALSFSGGAGTGAAGYASINSSGTVISVTITNRGQDYTSAPTVTVSGAGTGAVVTATIGATAGLTVFDTTIGEEYVWNGTVWEVGGSTSGSFSQVGAATTVFTVTLPYTQPNTTYKVQVTPTSVLSAALFYVTNKTSTTFDVTYLAGLTGSVSFDWLVTQ